MTSEQQMYLMRALVRDLKALHHELTAYHFLAQVVQDRCLSAEDVKRILDKARDSEKVQAATDRLFRGLDQILEQESETNLFQAVRELLDKWNPIGRPN